MPRGDGTGPMGMGPMTGRAAGYCAGAGEPGYMNPIPGRGFGRGFGRGGGGGFRGGFGGGRWGWRNRFYTTGIPGWRRIGGYAPPYGDSEQNDKLETEEEKKILKSRLEALQSELEALKNRLESMDKKDNKE